MCPVRTAPDPTQQPDQHHRLFIVLSSSFCFLLTFLATTLAAKLCLEMTHNALVQLFLSADFVTKEQSVDNISSANVSKMGGKKTKQYILSFQISCIVKLRMIIV